MSVSKDNYPAQKITHGRPQGKIDKVNFFVMNYFVYIIQCSDNSYYVGHTKELSARFEAHSNGTAAVHTKKFPPKQIVYTEAFNSEKAAIQRELQIKKWSRAKKEALILGDLEKLKKLSHKNFRNKVKH